MKKILLPVVNLALVSLLITSCSGAATPTATSTRSSPPTSTRPVPTASLIFTAAAAPSATLTSKLPISTEAAAYLEEALDIMQNNSLHRQSMHWDAIRTNAFEVAQHAQTPADTYDAIRSTLVRLGDHHSAFVTPDGVKQWAQETESDSPPPRGKLLLDKIGFIAIEGYTAWEGKHYATDAQQIIRDIDAQNPCGWIVDLRKNTGGNMGPMLAAIGPILGEGEVGADIDSYGNKQIWSYQDGQSKVDDLLYTQVIGPAYELRVSFPPVAVLTGVSTASSGEVIVVAFRGRPNTRSFGLPTRGLSTGNQGFPLSDGAMIILTTSVYVDRMGQTYGDKIYPDELVEDVRKFTFIMDEAIPQPAIDWLMSQPPCSAQN